MYVRCYTTADGCSLRYRLRYGGKCRSERWRARGHWVMRCLESHRSPRELQTIGGVRSVRRFMDRGDRGGCAGKAHECFVQERPRTRQAGTVVEQ